MWGLCTISPPKGPEFKTNCLKGVLRENDELDKIALLFLALRARISRHPINLIQTSFLFIHENVKNT